MSPHRFARAYADALRYAAENRLNGIPPEDAAFHAAIHAEPQNALPSMVYADWLEEHGKERSAAAIRRALRDGTRPPIVHDNLPTSAVGTHPEATITFTPHPSYLFDQPHTRSSSFFSGGTATLRIPSPDGKRIASYRVHGSAAEAAEAYAGWISEGAAHEGSSYLPVDGPYRGWDKDSPRIARQVFPEAWPSGEGRKYDLERGILDGGREASERSGDYLDVIEDVYRRHRNTRVSVADGVPTATRGIRLPNEDVMTFRVLDTPDGRRVLLEYTPSRQSYSVVRRPHYDAAFTAAEGRHLASLIDSPELEAFATKYLS